jgi:hypothetical protein
MMPSGLAMGAGAGGTYWFLEKATEIGKAVIQKMLGL